MDHCGSVVQLLPAGGGPLDGEKPTHYGLDGDHSGIQPHLIGSNTGDDAAPYALNPGRSNVTSLDESLDGGGYEDMKRE